MWLVGTLHTTHYTQLSSPVNMYIIIIILSLLQYITHLFSVSRGETIVFLPLYFPLFPNFQMFPPFPCFTTYPFHQFPVFPLSPPLHPLGEYQRSMAGEASWQFCNSCTCCFSTFPPRSVHLPYSSPTPPKHFS